MGQKGTNNNEEDARTRLLRAGTALFSEKGYASTSVREIVDRAGVTKPVLYYYFQNKQGLFRAILDRAAEQQEILLQEVFRKPGTVLQRLLDLWKRIYVGVQENQDLFRMIHNLVFGPPQGVPEYDFERYHRRMLDAIKKIYLEGISRQEVMGEDADDVAVLVLSLIDFCLHLDYLHPESQDPQRPERLLRLTFDGIGQRKEE